MKRKMDMNSEDISDDSLSKALNLFAKRTKKNQVTLVNDVNKLANKVEPGYLIKLAEEIERANDFVIHSACGKLKLIEDQMAALKRQALQILIETKINAVLHSLPCNFSKKVGQTYSVYQKPTEDYYFSLISPEEWGTKCPHKFIGSFKLDSGMAWSPVDEASLSSALHCWIKTANDDLMIK